MKKIDRRWIWIGLGVFTVLLRMVAGYYPHLVESWYSRNWFQWLRYVNDYTISLSPIPLFYVLLIGIFSYAIYVWFFRKKTKRNWRQRLVNFGFSTLAVLSALAFIFLTFWGFNYARVSVEDQLGMEVVPLDGPDLAQEFEILTKELIDVRNQFGEIDQDHFHQGVFHDQLETDLRSIVIETFQSLGYPTGGKVRARLLRPKGVLLRISTAGFYFPFVNECHVDAGLHPLQIPFVMAHELAHGYGITDEGSCNFFALLACSRSDDLVYRYSGLLLYWRYLAGEYRSYYPEEYKTAYHELLTEAIRGDLRAIRENGKLYPDIFPEFRNLAYSTYLRTQGIEEGMKNYNRVVMLATAWRKHHQLSQFSD